MLRWLAEPPLETIVAWTSPAAWASVVCGAVGMLALAAYPGKALFGVEFGPALLALSPTVVITALDIVLTRRQRSSELPVRISNLVGSAANQFFPLYVAATSRPVGMATFGALFLLVAVYQGFWNHATFRQPPAALVTPVAVGAALAIAGGRALLPILALGLVGAAAAVASGRLSLDLDRRRRENEALRAAVQAQIDAEREQTLSRLHESVVAASGQTHDMANQVQATVLCVASLEGQVARLGAGRGDAGLAETLHDLKGSVAALEELVRGARTELRSDRARLVQVDRVRPVAGLASALVTIGRRFPRVEFSCTEADPGVRAVLRGGQTTLVRILENLLANACEGDGRRGAARVQCGVRLLAARSVVCVAVRDDGPGFGAGLLERGIEGLSSTKPGGTGLGLYTVERQLRASGGELKLANGPEGGAEVQALLPAAPDQPA
jgi:two-component system, NtrC family, C4-dicarboxylate transport sensor histidine kinase DctB